MECRSCPYGEYDFIRRMACYERTIAEKGIPNDIYHYLEPEDAADEFEQFLWCDKVGGKVYCFGRCEDAHPELTEQKTAVNKRKRNKRERYLKHKKYIEKMCKENPYFPAYYKGEIMVHNGSYLEFIPNPHPYYKETHRGKRSKCLKKMSNRKIRRYKGELKNGNMCHRVFDFWWELD